MSFLHQSSPRSTWPASTSSAAFVLRSEYADIPAIAQFLPEYISGLARFVGILTGGLADRVVADLRRTVHQLRGNGGTYGFPDISLVAEQVEAAIDRNLDFELVAEKVRELVELIRRVEGYCDSDASLHRAASTGEATVFSEKMQCSLKISNAGRPE